MSGHLLSSIFEVFGVDITKKIIWKYALYIDEKGRLLIKRSTAKSRHMVQFWGRLYIVNCRNRSQDIYSGNMKDCKGKSVLKISKYWHTDHVHNATRNTSHTIQEKQTRILYITVTKDAVCAVDVTGLI